MNLIWQIVHKGSAQQKTVFCPHLPVVNIMTHLVKVWAKLCGDGDYPSRQHQLCLVLAQQLVLSGHIEIQVSCGGPQGWGQGSLRRRGTPSVKPMSVWRLYSCSFFFLSLSFSFFTRHSSVGNGRLSSSAAQGNRVLSVTWLELCCGFPSPQLCLNGDSWTRAW